MASATVWDQVLSRIEDQVGKHSFSTWFRPTSLLRDAGQRLSIRVPNPLFVEWLPKHYSVVIAEALKDVGRPDVELVFVPDGSAKAEETQPVDLAADPAVDEEPVIESPSGGLIPRYTFDSFIVGPSNQFAHAACSAVAESPSRSYNPLFLHGGVGLGKTHLMHAIGHYVLQHHAGLKLLYISSERFMNEMINALRHDQILDFRNRYRSVDVLLVDDIQFVSNREGTQNEFFHTFNSLHEAQKQIVISSDRPPNEIPALEERLRSRFTWGLIADIQPPDLETRAAILKKKAESERIFLADDVAMFIATKFKTNIRELEGSLTRLIAFASLRGQRPTMELAKEVIGKTSSGDEDKAITIEQIQRYVAEYFHLKLSELKSRNNSKSVAMPRQVAMYLCKTLTQASLPEIGRSFGGKHHSTVIHSIKKVEDLRARNSDFNRQVTNLLENLR